MLTNRCILCKKEECEWLGSDRALEVRGQQMFKFKYQKYWEGVYLTHLQCDLTLCVHSRQAMRDYSLPMVIYNNNYNDNYSRTSPIHGFLPVSVLLRMHGTVEPQ